MRPNTWALFLVGTTLGIVAATVLALVIPRMYPFQIVVRTGA
jgi:fumarate reductase subunit D